MTMNLPLGKIREEIFNKQIEFENTSVIQMYISYIGISF